MFAIDCYPDGKVYPDSIGDAMYRFIDIADVKAVLDSGKISISIRVDSLFGVMASKDTINMLNRDSVEGSIWVEYEANFDMNSNGDFDAGDLRVYAGFNTTPINFANDSTSLFRPEDFFIDGGVFRFHNSGTIRIGNATATFNNNTISISLVNSFGVTSNTPVRYVTSYFNPFFKYSYGDAY
jgi:hypothetical protein